MDVSSDLERGRSTRRKLIRGMILVSKAEGPPRAGGGEPRGAEGVAAAVLGGGEKRGEVGVEEEVLGEPTVVRPMPVIRYSDDMQIDQARERGEVVLRSLIYNICSFNFLL